MLNEHKKIYPNYSGMLSVADLCADNIEFDRFRLKMLIRLHNKKRRRLMLMALANGDY
ncbi:MAG: hypothetical protein P0116_09175 [Candidatus Nitrosocosmicus sp.]|nr:hypothetical protein [Candidatus Nitrosocosmicus sp.]